MKVQTRRSSSQSPRNKKIWGDEDGGESPAEVSIEDANVTACATGDISSHPQSRRPKTASPSKIPHAAIWESAEKF